MTPKKMPTETAAKRKKLFYPTTTTKERFSVVEEEIELKQKVEQRIKKKNKKYLNKTKRDASRKLTEANMKL